MRTIAEILQQLPTSADNGLTAAGVPLSRQRFGANRLTPLPREPLWRKFLEKFDEPIIKILLAAALLSMIVDLFKVPGNGPLMGGVGVGLIALAVAAAYVLRQSQWVPSLLFGLAILCFFTGLAIGHTSVEGLAVMVAVILATGVAFLSEYKSDREFEVLNAHKDSLHVKVLRDAAFHTVSLEDVAVGDAVLLETGDEIPADGRVVRATELLIDQSLMTGESNPVRKQAAAADDMAEGTDQPGCLYRGTQVVDGVGLMLVTEVGDATALGQISRRLSADDGESEAEHAAPDSEEKRVQRKLTISKELTPLQQKLEKLADLISRVGYLAAVLIFLAQLLRGIISGEIHWPDSMHDAIHVFSALLDYFVLMVIIIVVAVPEGLPMSVTVSLALAMQKMTRANSLVRQLVACETIGSATVICSDKTGTLTQNKMQVVRVAWEDKLFDRDAQSTWLRGAAPSCGSGADEPLSPRTRGERDWREGGRPGQDQPPSPPTPLPPSTGREGSDARLDLGGAPWPGDGTPLQWIALNAAVNSTANLEEKEGKRVVVGNATEGALLQWLRENDVSHAELRLQFPPLYQIHFSSERKRMTTVIRQGDRLAALVKGAPEWVLQNSTHYQAADGSVKEWSAEAREATKKQLGDTSSRAMRTLAFGFAWLPPDSPSTADELHASRDALESSLVYCGFVAIRDPLRPDVKDAIEKCRRAGIEVKMVTGDNVETARAIGYDIGLIERPDEAIDGDGAVVLTSPQFNALSDDDLKRCLPKMRILARARPLDKFRMVRLLQELGEVVAVTGDGTNDAPALKKADVGLAMGIAGTEVAKEASKIVLLDDSFATIVKAVHWGRSLFENIQRFIQFQVTINISALTIAFLGPLLFGVKAPFSVLQLLWINVIMDTFASIALCSEPPRPGLMDLPPKRRDDSIVTKPMLWTIFTTAAFFVVVMLGLLVAMKGGPNKPGLFAGNGDWSFETSGNRYPVAAAALEPDARRQGEWVVHAPEEPALDGQVGDAGFTVLQVSIFFSVYVFFQVWNQINCRSLVPQVSGFHRILENPTFLAIAATVAIGQIVIVTFGGSVFKVEPLGPLQWLVIIVSTASVLVFAEVARRVRLAMNSSGGPSS